MNNSYRVIIIEDETPARRWLKTVLSKQEPEINIIAEAGTVEDAIEKIDTNMPDLIFLDINLRGKNSFEVLEKITCRPLIVFTTAYDEYALQAFDTNSVSYILKPVTEEKIRKCFDKLKTFGNKNDFDKLRTISEGLGCRKLKTELTNVLHVKSGGRITLVQITDIIFLEAADRYTYVYINSGTKYLSDDLLMTVSEKLPAYFLRVQKSYIINTKRIREVHRHSNSRFSLFLDDSARTNIITGPVYYNALKTYFNL